MDDYASLDEHGPRRAPAPKLSPQTVLIQPEDKRRSVARPRIQYASIATWGQSTLLRYLRALTGSAYIPVGNIYRIIPSGLLSLRPIVAMGLHIVGVLIPKQVLTLPHDGPEKIPARGVSKQPSFSCVHLRGL